MGTLRISVSVFVLSLIPQLVPSLQAAEDPAKVKNTYIIRVDDARIDPQVLAVPGDKFVITLVGEVNSDAEREEILTRVKKDPPSYLEAVRDKIRVKNPGPPKEQDKETTDLWNLTYIRSRVTPTGEELGNSNNPAERDSIDDLVLAMNQAFDPQRQRAVQRAGRGRLLLRGTEADILKMKRFLALVDAPWPQVQMNLWAIQITGTPEKIANRVRLITQQIRRTRDRMSEVQRHLTRTVTRPKPKESKLEKLHWEFLEQQFDVAGIHLNPHKAQSLNEALVLLLLHPCRESKVQDLQSFIASRKETWLREDDQDWPHETALLPRERHRLAAKLEETRRQQVDAFGTPFRRLLEVVRMDGYEAEREGFFDFRDALHCFHAPKAEGHFDAPRRLLRTGATVDSMLKGVMDAFSADMADLFLDPLLGRIEASDPLDETDGVALVGKSRIVVTSGLEAGLEPQMVSFAETGRPQPFGREVLESAFPTSSTPAANLLGLPDAQAVALAALLAADTTPSFTKVAPGIAIHVKPTVLPDGGAARIAIDAMFGVMSTAPATGETGFFGDTPADAIESHHVQTDAAVTAFDLFDISSFALTSSRPQAPFYVPVLGQLPVLGKAFQFPRKPKETHFESMLLVNTVILPRSLELYRFYGRETELPDASKAEPRVCCKGRRPPTDLLLRCDAPLPPKREFQACIDFSAPAQSENP